VQAGHFVKYRRLSVVATHVRSRPGILGALFATTTAVTWGGQFVVGKSALDTVNAFPLSTVRYFVASVLWLAVLWAVEGRRSLLPGGHGLRLFWLGTLGFGGFNLLGFTGLAHARPESASLIVALAPLLTALVLWRRTRVRPTTATFAFMALALAGVALVISAGHPSRIFSGAIGWGDLLVLAAVFCFVLYGLGAASLPAFSPLRYTALTASLGWFTLAGATLAGAVSGLVPMPSAQELLDVGPQLAYLALPGAFMAVLTWNASIKLIGAANTALFGNLIPVTTFAITIAQGYRPGPVEVFGALLTVGALVANNLVARRPSVAERPAVAAEEGDLRQRGEQGLLLPDANLRMLPRLEVRNGVAVDDHLGRDVA
jgi:drug/metabolite transporter (DMT)-like permease